MNYARRALSHAEFVERVARFEELYPGGTQNSGWRSPSWNTHVGSGPSSKHLLGSPLTPIAVDIDYHAEPDESKRVEMNHTARILGLFGLYHRGHMHLQGLPVGPPPAGWRP